MNDDQLRQELERRSSGAQFRADELLPGVRSRIGVRPQPARVARWAPLAGLAAAAVIVVALVIVFPRGPSVIGPGASTPSASAAEVDCLLDGATFQITISDETGLIQSCSSIPVDALGSPGATGQGPMTSVALRLTGSPCDITAPLLFTHESNGYYLRSSRPASGACPASLMDAAIRLNLRAPIDRSSVSVLLGAAAATQLPIQHFDCGGQISVDDHSGLLQGCQDAGIVDRHSQDPAVSNPSGDLHTVHVWWGISESSTVTAIDVYRTSDDAYYVSVVNVASPGSFLRPDAHAVDLNFDVPVPAPAVTLRTYSGASASIGPSQSASPSPIACDRDPSLGQDVAIVSVQDDSGLIVGCTQNVATDPLSVDSVWNLTPTRLLVLWESGGCAAPIPLSFAVTTGGYSLSGPRTCILSAGRRYEIELQFASAIDASSVTTDLNRGVTMASPLPTPSPAGASTTSCPDFTPPPDNELRAAPGISVVAIDKGHFEITNATIRSYYGGVTTWLTEDDLVCGRGVIAHASTIGRIAPGATVVWSGGSTSDVPVTVEIWDRPCGEGCDLTPIGAYLVPISSVEPVPLST